MFVEVARWTTRIVTDILMRIRIRRYGKLRHLW
jgi:hypothetical protein